MPLGVPEEDVNILILGAHHGEKHIQQFAKEQCNCVSNIVCVVDESTFRSTGCDPKCVAKCIQENWDFNSTDAWKKCKKKYKNFQKIIVDWSTAKFFRREYNIHFGKIWPIIESMLSHENAQFFLPIEKHDASVGEYNIKYFNPPTLMYKVEYDPDMTIYKRILLYYMSLDFETHIMTAEKEGDYPLKNKGFKYPFEYLYCVRRIM